MAGDNAVASFPAQTLALRHVEQEEVVCQGGIGECVGRRELAVPRTTQEAADEGVQHQAIGAPVLAEVCLAEALVAGTI